jgi:transcriptional regulator with GAF, ATPase, and Fis domain
MTAPDIPGSETAGAPPVPARRLERLQWMNWFLGFAVLILTAAGLTLVLVALLGNRAEGIWPWPQSERALALVLVLVNLLFVSYLTWEQRRVMKLRRELEDAQEARVASLLVHQSRLEAILSVARAMGNQSGAQALFDCITETCRGTFPSDQVSLMLLDRERTHLEVRSASGHPDAKQVLGARQEVGRGIAGWVVEHRKPLILGGDVDRGRFQDVKTRSYHTSAAMVVPVILRDELIGVLSVSSRSPGVVYTEDDLKALMVFAESTGIYCRHAELSDWMRQTIRSMETALARYRAEETDRAA